MYTQRGYALKQSLKQFKRYKFASTTTLLVLGITLALPVILLFAGNALQQLGMRNLEGESLTAYLQTCLLYTSPSPRDGLLSRMPSSA